MYSCRQSYHEFSPGTRDRCDSSSYMVSSSHFSRYSAYRTQNTTGAESSPGFRSTHYSKSAGGHRQDENSIVALPIVYSNATSRGSSFDPSPDLVDRVDASQIFETVSDNVLCKIGLHVSMQRRPGHDTGDFYSCPVCHTVSPCQEKAAHVVASATLVPASEWWLCMDRRLLDELALALPQKPSLQHPRNGQERSHDLRPLATGGGN